MIAQFQIILPDCSNKFIALSFCDGAYSLPSFCQAEEVRYNTVTGINARLLKEWNLSATVSRCVFEGDVQTPAIFAMHNHDQAWQPEPFAAVWVGLDEIAKINCANTAQRERIMEWVDSLNDPAWKHVPWSSPDWAAKAISWMKECVKATGASIISGPTQVRAWAISSVWMVETSAGKLWFKAVPDFFAHAPNLEKYLSEHFAKNLIDIVAIETNEHWMLSKEWAGENPTTIEQWAQILKVVMDIQMNCTDRLDELLSFGCKDRRLANLPVLLNPVFDDLMNESMFDIYGINGAEAEELSRRLEQLPSLCQELAAFKIPETLIHGDLWGNNIIVRDHVSGKSPVIFDWTDASITHPFIDIYLLLTSEPDVAKRPLIRETFVSVWSENYSKDIVEAALNAAELIAPFYFLCTFRVVQLNAPGQSRWELSFLFQRFVRNVLMNPLFAS
ncbi:MAG: phosphotransferase [Candidatus Obscuribacterales bacterium]|nr:phosphotransferase [Candidatus Obscuribacterales bacterium]